MNLTKKAKIALASGGVGLAALAVALGIWQPWNQQEVPQPPAPPVQNQQHPQPQKETLTLTIGGEKIPCTLYEGDGWSIYVPESWTVDAKENGGIFYVSEDKNDSPRVEVTQNIPSVYGGDFVSAYPQQLSDTETWQTRTFYHADSGEGWELTCQAPKDMWDDCQRIMTAMARTFAVDGEMIFSGFSPVASQPDWQVTGDGTVLWMDKDGYIVNDELEEYICTEMMGWPNEKKVYYTGQYRMDDLTWAGSYTCVSGKEYIDIFQTKVYYEIASGKESELLLAGGMSVEDGWLYEGYVTQVVLYHDGSAVDKVRVIHTNDTTPGLPLFLSDLMQNDPDVVQELDGEELKVCAEWFNEKENNGLLRFPYETDAGIEDILLYLDVLFYDLGETGDAITQKEKAALKPLGITDENCAVYKLSREYVRGYLQEKLGFGDDEVDKLLEGLPEGVPGAFLKEYDAWYQCHGDTAYMPYVFDKGEFHPSLGGHVKLYYTAPYLSVADTDGLFNEPMVVTLQSTADGEWVVRSNLQKIYAE